MVRKKIDEILQEMKIPGPDETAKKTAIKASLDEFNRQKPSFQKKSKCLAVCLTVCLTQCLTLFYIFS